MPHRDCTFQRARYHASILPEVDLATRLSGEARRVRKDTNKLIYVFTSIPLAAVRIRLIFKVNPNQIW